MRRNPISIPHLKYRIYPSNKINALRDFGNETAMHMSATHAISKNWAKNSKSKFLGIKSLVSLESVPFFEIKKMLTEKKTLNLSRNSTYPLMHQLVSNRYCYIKYIPSGKVNFICINIVELICHFSKLKK